MAEGERSMVEPKAEQKGNAPPVLGVSPSEHCPYILYFWQSPAGSPGCAGSPGHTISPVKPP